MAQYRITTPEQVHFHYETAGLWSRAVAWIVDQFLLLLLRLMALWALLSAGGLLAGGYFSALSVGRGLYGIRLFLFTSERVNAFIF